MKTLYLYIIQVIKSFLSKRDQKQAENDSETDTQNAPKPPTEVMDTMTIETALAEVSAALGVPPAWLRNLIQFESGGSPLIRNKFTGAGGLIQFMPDTAKALGFASVDDLLRQYPDAVSQLLNPVKRYFLELPGNKPPYPTEQSLYMTVFYPAARSWSPDTVFSDSVRKVNPGIDTVADYVAHVKRQAVIKTAVKTGGSLLLLLALGVGAYFLYQHLQGRPYD